MSDASLAAWVKSFEAKAPAPAPIRRQPRLIDNGPSIMQRVAEAPATREARDPGVLLATTSVTIGEMTDEIMALFKDQA